MCGRYTIIATAIEIERRFEATLAHGFTARFNAAPTQLLPVVSNENPGIVSLFRWGMLSNWAGDRSIQPIINSRIETITERPTFREAIQKRRCLIPADGYYEWKRLSKKSKIPYRVCLENDELFSFAGIWGLAYDANKKLVPSFSIITSCSSDELGHIHDRMPLILNRDAEKQWLTQSMEIKEISGFLLENRISKLKTFPVSSRVNSVINDNPDLIIPAPAIDQFGNFSLFD